MSFPAGVYPRLHHCVLTMALAASGCASSPARTVAWDPSMQPLFSGNPAAPAGQHAQDWTPEAEERLMQQMGYADIVALATVREVRRHDRYGNPRDVSLAFRLRAVIHGNLLQHLGEPDELMLDLGEETEAFSATLRRLRELPDARYLVFIKRSGSEAKATLRWAFYQPSPRLLSRVQAMYRDLRHKG